MSDIITRIKAIIRQRRDNTHTRKINRVNGIEVGCYSVIYYKSNIYNSRGGVIKIGKNCRIGSPAFHYHAGMPFFSTIWAEGPNAIVTVGDNCRLNGTYIHAKSIITIGNNCVMASGISIIDSNGHQVNSLDRTKGSDTPKEIIIGNNCWIGVNAIILKGTILGDNCVVGAGCVVQGAYPANSIIKQAENTVSEIIMKE